MDNSSKAEALANTFFPPPPSTPIILAMAYPKLLKARGIFMRSKIKNAIRKLKPYKAPGIDSIHNIVLQECTEVLVNNLYFIYCTILELNTYPIRWLIILTIVLQKAGKAAYNVAKAYQPIGLLKMLGKLFTTLIVADLSYLTEKHQLLPPTQFGRSMEKERSSINSLSRYTSSIP